VKAENDEQNPETVRGDECWKHIGVVGDGTCPELAAVVHCRNCPVFVAAGMRLFEREPPADYVEEQTRLLARKETAESSDTVAVAVFRIGEEWLAFAVDVVVEVCEPRIIHRIPHRSNDRLLGLVNIRGELQLCIGLGSLLGVAPGEREEAASEPLQPRPLASKAAPGLDARSNEESPSVVGVKPRNSETHGRLLVAEYREQRWVFSVDEVAGIHRIAVDRFTDLPSTVANSPKRFSQAVFAWEGRSVGLLANDRLFESLEGSVG
jgi:chemotaxis-related protein WspD